MYVSAAELAVFLGSLSTGSSTALQPYVEAAQSEIENVAGTVFEASTGTKYYRAEDLVAAGDATRRYPVIGLDGGYTAASLSYSRRVLYLRADLFALGGLTNGDGTTIASTDCWLEPRNQAPYQTIRPKSNIAWNFNTDGEIIVSGSWGYSSSAPATVVQLTRELAAYMYRAKDAQTFDVVANAELGIITTPKSMRRAIESALSRQGLIRRAVIL